MRLALDPRARRLLRRVPHTSVYSAAELLLLSLLAIQCARLVWTLVTPVGPVGDWRVESTVRAPVAGSSSLLGEFDPFFRLSGDSGPVVVTSLDLKLFGVREDRATGRGSAIIGTPDGQQRSFTVGEEIVPGVVLTAVDFDSITLSRSGTAERMFLDQSPPAAVVAPEGADADEAGLASAAAPSAAGSIASDIRFQPRLEGSRVTGVTVHPQGSGNAFRAAGLAPGDVILSVNGRRITDVQQVRGIAEQLGGSAEIAIEVERDGRVVPLRVRPGQ